jgi:succinate-semialdehyde dehydrogenase/glutarate-semialdehyde dehydrogenase
MTNILNSALLENGSLINGIWQTQGESHFSVFNPATNDVIQNIVNATSLDAKTAVDAATKALPSWRAKTAKERAVILKRWFDLLIEHQDELARILTAEQGKPLAEAKGEVVYGANYLEWFAEEAKRIYGDIVPAQNTHSKVLISKQPIGVVSAITPWNFPVAMITRKAAPALAAGCTFIVKAASETPLSAIAIAKLGVEAGIPPGVLNVLVSNKSHAIGEVLTTDPRIAKFSFTGSTQVGKILLAQCASTVKKTSMELGGNAPFIVFDDAQCDEAVKGLMASKYRNAGQTCVCTNRILVQSSIYDKFVKKFSKAVDNLTLGHGDQASTDIGPLITSNAANDVIALVDDAVTHGANIVTGGHISTAGANFVAPTILTNVLPSMNIARDEIFGPVAAIIKFENEEEAVRIANDTNVGLASYIYTRDIGRIWRVSDALEYGMVGINEGIISNEMAPFGGVKESGSGREGSKYGLDDYLEIKYLCMGGLDK